MQGPSYSHLEILINLPNLNCLMLHRMCIYYNVAASTCEIIHNIVNHRKEHIANIVTLKV